MKKRTSELDRIIRRGLYLDEGQIKEGVGIEAKAIHRARCLLKSGKLDAAIDELAIVKSRQKPQEGVDLLRAQCFMEKGLYLDATEALREELRWFPENQVAQAMMKRLEAKSPKLEITDVCDNELRSVLEVIRPYTMMGEKRLCSLYRLARRVCEAGVLGNFVECGVAAGGSSALLAWVIKNYSRHPRKLFAFDSFAGMPNPTSHDTHKGIPAGSTGWGAGTCSAPESSVWDACRLLGAQDVLNTVKGPFEKTLPSQRDWAGMIALLHIDGDWYESTRCVLDNLYDRLNNDSVVQIDDYGYWDGCRKAVHDFEIARSIHFDLKTIDETGVWFEKPERFSTARDVPEEIIHDFEQDHPQRFGIISQMSSNEQFQMYFTIRCLLPTRRRLLQFIEIGSFAGASLQVICSAIRHLNAPYLGVVVEAACLPELKDVVRQFNDHVMLLQMYSHEASQRLSKIFTGDNLSDFILIDGDHSYNGVSRDILEYYPLLAPGGIMMMHDYLPPLDDGNRDFIYAHHAGKEPGIRQACKEILEGVYGLQSMQLPLLYPQNPSQSQAHLPIIPGVYSTIRAYRKPEI